MIKNSKPDKIIKAEYLKIMITALALVFIGYLAGNYYFSTLINTPEKTLNQIEKASKTGDFEKFDDCCLNQDKIFNNIQNRLLKDPEFQSNLAKEIIQSQISEAKENFRKDFKAKESFQKPFNKKTIKETENGFTVEAKNSEGKTNLLTFEKVEGGFELVDSETIN